MKQKYYIACYRYKSGAWWGNPWLTVVSASKEFVDEKLEAADEIGKSEEVEFDNYFIRKPWGRGSEATTFDHKSFRILAESKSCRGESMGNYYCVAGMDKHPEVRRAVEARKQGERSAMDSYYSRPWV